MKSAGSVPGHAARRLWARARIYAIPTLVLLALTLPHLEQGDFRTDTGWYAAIGLSSVRHWAQAHGLGDLLTLQAEPGKPFFNKPPLALWIHGVALDVFGVSLTAARLPTIAAACASVALSVGIVRRFGTSTQALMAGMALALTIEFFRRTKEISLDMWQLGFMLGAVLVVASTRRAGTRNAVVSGALIGLSLLCKPLVGLLASLILLVWVAMRRRDTAARAPKALTPSPLREDIPLPVGEGGGLTGWGVAHFASAVVVAAPWYAAMAMEHGGAFLSQHFVGEVAERAMGAMGAEAGTTGGGREPMWFYLALVGQTYWPWLVTAVFAIAALARGEFNRRGRSVVVLALIWLAAWLVLLTVFPDRRPRYALVLWPAGAVLSGMWIGLPAGRPIRPVVRTIVRWGAPIAVVAGVAFAFLPVQVQKPASRQWPALFEWMEQEGVNELWQGGFSGPSGSRLYLRFGKWPIQTQDRKKQIMTRPPPGALIVYHRRDGYAPGTGEQEVFREGDLTVTRLVSGSWEPVRTPDPGEDE